MDWSRAGIGVGAAFAFAIGAFRVSTTAATLDGYALLAVSMILVGVSLALDFHERWCQCARHHKDRHPVE